MRLGDWHFPSPRLWIRDVPAGGAVTTVSDHSMLLLAHLPGATAAVVSEGTRNDCVRVPDATEGEWGVGLLWQSGHIGTDLEWIGHGGGHMGGFTTRRLVCGCTTSIAGAQHGGRSA